MAIAKMKKLIVIWVLSCGFFAQAQEVNKDFSKLLLNDQFDQADKNWNSTFNADNLFIAQNGFFELYRKSKKSGYYLFPNKSEEYTAFQVEAGLVFAQHDNGKQSAGLLLMANSETGGGLLVEINQKKQYRIVRVYKDKQVPLNSNGDGWQKATAAITKTENQITIKTYDKVYDLYINGVFVQTFTDIELNKGKIGIYVGPDSKVKFDFLKVLGEDKTELLNFEIKDAKGEEQAFTQIILKLKEQINKRDKDIDDYKTKLKLCESGGFGKSGSDTAANNLRNRLLAKVAVLEEENNDLQTKVMGMEEEIKALNDFKTGVEKGNDGDIVINLTNMVSNQKASLDALEKANKVLNEENNSLFMEIKDLTKALYRATNEITTLKANQVAHQSEIDSLKKQISILKDSIQRKQMELNVKNGLPEKELTEDEKLQMMIEKEREERRKRREEEERKRKEAEQNNGNG